ncbi:MAG TPA: hypothetical protein VGF77_10825 [Allosphingosinicella sp.]|jgi:hypothetical protein
MAGNQYANQYAIRVYMPVVGRDGEAELATKANQIELAQDGTLKVTAEKATRVFRPNLWNRLEVEWLAPQEPFTSGKQDA